MLGFVDRVEQYLVNDYSRVLFWMFGGVGENDDVQRRVLILRLSENEYEKFSSREKSQNLIDVFREVSSNLAYPDARVLFVNRLPHYSAVSVDFHIDSSECFDNVLQQLNSISAGRSVVVKEDVING